MTKRLLIATALAAALLGGCTIHYHQHHAPPPPAGGSGDPKAPRVIISNGNISVDQDVLRFAKDQTDVTITWRLEGKGGKGGKLTFPENGVVFERAADGEIVDCKRSQDNTVFTCVNRHSRPGVYRYGINVNEDGKPLKPLDPYVWND